MISFQLIFTILFIFVSIEIGERKGQTRNRMRGERREKRSREKKRLTTFRKYNLCWINTMEEIGSMVSPMHFLTSLWMLRCFIITALQVNSPTSPPPLLLLSSLFSPLHYARKCIGHPLLRQGERERVVFPDITLDATMFTPFLSLPYSPLHNSIHFLINA